MPPGNFLRGPAGHDGSSSVPALGSHVDDVIGSLDDVEVVLDHDGGIAALDKFAQDTGQLGDVVKTGTEFVILIIFQICLMAEQLTDF